MRILLYTVNSRSELLYRTVLERMIHTVTVIDDCTLIAETIITYDFDIIVLDLPDFFIDQDKISLIRECDKISGDAAILILSESGTESARLTAIEQGAYDCLIGSPNIKNIEIVINSLARRLEGKKISTADCGPLKMDRTTHVVELEGKQIKLTPKEFILLELLLKRKGSIVTTEFIMSHIFSAKEFGGANLVHPHICRLRAKIKHSGIRIESEYGVGYRMSVM